MIWDNTDLLTEFFEKEILVLLTNLYILWTLHSTPPHESRSEYFTLRCPIITLRIIFFSLIFRSNNNFHSFLGCLDWIYLLVYLDLLSLFVTLLLVFNGIGALIIVFFFWLVIIAIRQLIDVSLLICIFLKGQTILGQVHKWRTRVKIAGLAKCRPFFP